MDGRYCEEFGVSMELSCLVQGKRMTDGLVPKTQKNINVQNLEKCHLSIVKATIVRIEA